MTEGETDSCFVCEWAERDTGTHLYVCKGGVLWLLAYHRCSQLPNEDFHSIWAKTLACITRIILVLGKSALSVPDTRFSRVSGSTLISSGHPILSGAIQTSPHILWQGMVSLLFIRELEPFAPPGSPRTSWFVSVSMWHRWTQAVNCC